MATDSLLNDLQVSATSRLVEALVDSENRMRQRLDLLAEVVFELDSAGLIVYVNRAWEALTGIPAISALGKTLDGFMLPEDSGLYQEVLAQATDVPQKDCAVLRFPNQMNTAHLMELSIVAIRTGYVGALHDVTLHKSAMDQLSYMAHFDVLTKMPNRVLLSDRLQRAMLSCKRSFRSLAVAFLDLDGFKSVNDQYGHDVGDQLLKTLASRLSGALRQGDSIARLGGDEFVVLLVDLDDSHDCQPVLERLLRAASDLVIVEGHELQVSASIGVTIYPSDVADADQLIRHADQAMYIAKQTGKNRIHYFDVTLDSARQIQNKTFERLEIALGEDEFVLFFQPKVNLLTGEVWGAEALIRWQHPDRGLLLPGEFLPFIENHFLSLRIGEWVISTAFAQQAAWHALGLSITISVNVGADQLLDERFIMQLRAQLERYPMLQPSMVMFEILETSALRDTERVSEVIRTCQAMGFMFALDDFGTGYSSLTYLRQFPAEVLKIDRSFVIDMLTDRDDMAIVKGILGLAKVFRRKVIAEGVETAAQMRKLRQLSCEFAQGYGIARPMPGQDLAAWVQQWEAGQIASLRNA